MNFLKICFSFLLIFPINYAYALVITENDGYTFGDVYNQGEIKDRNKVNFQKNKSLDRLERADGKYDLQRKRFLTEESLNHSHLILSAKQGVGYVETPKFISIRKDKTLSQAKFEEEKNKNLYENRSKANEVSYGQRLQKHSQKRVILLFQSQNRKNSLQDSTYVEIDRDMTLPPSPYNINSIDKNRIHTYK